MLCYRQSFASAQHYTTINAPGAGTSAGQGAFLQNVTDSGLTFGYDVDSNNVAHGFLRSRQGNYTTFDILGAGTGAGQGTSPYSINPAVTITGQYIDSSNVIHDFLRTVDGTITKFDARREYRCWARHFPGRSQYRRSEHRDVLRREQRGTRLPANTVVKPPRVLEATGVRSNASLSLPIRWV